MNSDSDSTIPTTPTTSPNVHDSRAVASPTRWSINTSQPGFRIQHYRLLAKRDREAKEEFLNDAGSLGAAEGIHSDTARFDT